MTNKLAPVGMSIRGMSGMQICRGRAFYSGVDWSDGRGRSKGQERAESLQYLCTALVISLSSSPKYFGLGTVLGA